VDVATYGEVVDAVPEGIVPQKENPFTPVTVKVTVLPASVTGGLEGVTVIRSVKPGPTVFVAAVTATDETGTVWVITTELDTPASASVTATVQLAAAAFAV
jgi:hypothetical protein